MLIALLSSIDLGFVTQLIESRNCLIARLASVYYNPLSVLQTWLTIPCQRYGKTAMSDTVRKPSVGSI